MPRKSDMFRVRGPDANVKTSTLEGAERVFVEVCWIFGPLVHWRASNTDLREVVQVLQWFLLVKSQDVRNLVAKQVGSTQLPHTEVSVLAHVRVESEFTLPENTAEVVQHFDVRPEVIIYIV